MRYDVSVLMYEVWRKDVDVGSSLWVTRVSLRQSARHEVVQLWKYHQLKQTGLIWNKLKLTPQWRHWWLLSAITTSCAWCVRSEAVSFLWVSESRSESIDSKSVCGWWVCLFVLLKLKGLLYFLKTFETVYFPDIICWKGVPNFSMHSVLKRLFPNSGNIWTIVQLKYS